MMTFLSVNVIIIIVLLTTICIVASTPTTSHSITGLGPHVRQTWGEPWPKPQRSLTYGDNFMVVRISVFRFKVTNFTCDMVDLALKRYYTILHEQHIYRKRVISNNGSTSNNSSGYRGHFDVLEIHLMSPCEQYPHDGMDESYKLKIDIPSRPGRGVLQAQSNWGILRGLETFSQIVHHSPDHSALRVKSTFIHDFPRFPFRSVLLDTSRHFLTKEVLFQNLDLMAINKMNVFHWHIVDDPSFPYESKAFPDLSFKGAYNPYTHVYAEKDVADIIEYARLRGIRVIPEFDTPGHTQSWGPAVPNLLTKCYKNNSAGGGVHPDGTFGPIDPTVETNYDFLTSFFSEVGGVFPDKYLHLGGDEVDFGCWDSNPAIKEFMTTKNMTTFASLEEYYVQRVIEIVEESLPQKKVPIVWQEVVDNGVEIAKDTVVNVWKGTDHPTEYEEELGNVTALGYRALLYSCWYMDRISWGIDWPSYYKCDPQSFKGSPTQKALILGGGAALWTEFADSTNSIQRLWPRTSAPAERLWSSEMVKDVEKAAGRMEEHRCRMRRRGYPVQPANGPGFCDY